MSEVPDVQEFRVTFGQKYRREPHPCLPVAHPDGWLTVFGFDELDARRIVVTHLGTAWAFIYSDLDAEHWQMFYPLGELHRMGRLASPEGGKHARGLP